MLFDRGRQFRSELSILELETQSTKYTTRDKIALCHFHPNYIALCPCRRRKFPTYHKLTRHTIKSTKYNQLQSTTYCCQVLLSLLRNQQKFAKCHAKTNHISACVSDDTSISAGVSNDTSTSARVNNDTSTSARVSDDTSSPARVSNDIGSLARVSNDIGRPIRL